MHILSVWAGLVAAFWPHADPRPALDCPGVSRGGFGSRWEHAAVGLVHAAVMAYAHVQPCVMTGKCMGANLGGNFGLEPT